MSAKTLKEKVLEATVALERSQRKLAVAEKEIELRDLDIKNLREARASQAETRNDNMYLRGQVDALNAENNRLKGYIDRVIDERSTTHRGPRIIPDELPVTPYVEIPTPPREFNY